MNRYEREMGIVRERNERLRLHEPPTGVDLRFLVLQFLKLGKPSAADLHEKVRSTGDLVRAELQRPVRLPMSDGRGDYNNEYPQCVLHTVPGFGNCFGCSPAEETVVPIYHCKVGNGDAFLCVSCARRVDDGSHPYLRDPRYTERPPSAEAVAALQRDVTWEDT